MAETIIAMSKDMVSELMKNLDSKGSLGLTALTALIGADYGKDASSFFRDDSLPVAIAPIRSTHINVEKSSLDEYIKNMTSEGCMPSPEDWRKERIYSSEISYAPPSKREMQIEARCMSLNYILTKHRDLAGRGLIAHGISRNHVAVQVQDIEEILHITNFRRSSFGYSRHSDYQDHLRKLAGQWDKDLHLELVQHLEPDLKEFNAKMEAMTVATMAATTAKIEDSPPKVVLVLKHDPVDYLPEGLLEMLNDQAERAIPDAKTGSW